MAKHVISWAKEQRMSPGAIIVICNFLLCNRQTRHSREMLLLHQFFGKRILHHFARCVENSFTVQQHERLNRFNW